MSAEGLIITNIVSIAIGMIGGASIVWSVVKSRLDGTEPRLDAAQTRELMAYTKFTVAKAIVDCMRMSLDAGYGLKQTISQIETQFVLGKEPK